MGTTKAKKKKGEKNGMNAPCRRRWRIFSFFGCHQFIVIAAASMSSSMSKWNHGPIIIIMSSRPLSSAITTHHRRVASVSIRMKTTTSLFGRHRRLYHIFLHRRFFFAAPACLVCLVCRRLDARLPHYLRQIFNIASVEYIFFIYIIAHYISFCLSFHSICARLFSRCRRCCAMPCSLLLVLVFGLFCFFFFFFVCRFFTCAFPSWRRRLSTIPYYLIIMDAIYRLSEILFILLCLRLSFGRFSSNARCATAKWAALVAVCEPIFQLTTFCRVRSFIIIRIWCAHKQQSKRCHYKQKWSFVDSPFVFFSLFSARTGPRPGANNSKRRNPEARTSVPQD